RPSAWPDHCNSLTARGFRRSSPRPRTVRTIGTIGCNPFVASLQIPPTKRRYRRNPANSRASRVRRGGAGSIVGFVVWSLTRLALGRKATHAGGRPLTRDLREARTDGTDSGHRAGGKTQRTR